MSAPPLDDPSLKVQAVSNFSCTTAEGKIKDTVPLQNQKNDSQHYTEEATQTLPSPVSHSMEDKISPTNPPQQQSDVISDAPYSIFSEPIKITVIITSSFAALISPISASIYYPALNPLAADLHVSLSAITLTITTYMV